jgi:hypothetical protein
LRQNSSALFPPEFYLNFLRSASVKALIGAKSTYRECANAPFNLFTKTGDVSDFVLLYGLNNVVTAKIMNL